MRKWGGYLSLPFGYINNITNPLEFNKYFSVLATVFSDFLYRSIKQYKLLKNSQVK